MAKLEFVFEIIKYVVVQRINVPLTLILYITTTHYTVGHFRDDFYRSCDQTNSAKALEETSWSFR